MSDSLGSAHHIRCLFWHQDGINQRNDTVSDACSSKYEKIVSLEDTRTNISGSSSLLCIIDKSWLHYMVDSLCTMHRIRFTRLPDKITKKKQDANINLKLAIL